MATRIKLGTTFRYHYADSIPLWKVVKSRGKGNWLCEIVNEPIEIDGQMFDSDWVGNQKVFGSEEIRSCIAHEELVASIMDDSEQFYNSLKVGAIVHYHNGFNSYVRCQVVREQNETKLLPLALVGNWQDYDLPHYNVLGEIEYPHHARNIAEKQTFRPHASNIYEFTKRGDNPTNMPEIDLNVPPLPKEEQEKAALCRKLRDIQHAINLNEPENSLQRITDILKGENQ